MSPNLIPLHESFNARVDILGVEREPVIVIDNLLAAPEKLVEHAAAHSGSFRQDTDFYPGIRLPCPKEYVFSVHGHLKRLLSEVFQLPGSGVHGQSSYSIVTVRPQDLTDKQRIPHYDIPDRQNIAMIHYLCPNTFGGTSFYRHVATGFESIDEPRVEEYANILGGQIQRSGPPEAAYINGDTKQFQQIATYGAEFNRALIYRGSSLQSDDIPPEYERDPDPRTGRLSITSFFKTGM